MDLEEKIENSAEEGFLDRLWKRKWLRRSILPLATTTSMFLGTSRADAALKGDFNRDKKVNLDDFFEFADYFGTNTKSKNWDQIYDLDKNNQVDFEDFFIFTGYFGKSIWDFIKSQLTDSQGKVSFSDDENKKTINIQIKDNQNKQGLKDVAVSYFSGEGYKVFLAARNGYLPFRKVYSDKDKVEELLDNIFILIDKTRENKAFLQRLKEKEEIAAVTNWEEDNYMITKESYLMTVDKEEKLKVDEVNDLAVSIAGAVGEIYDGSLSADQFKKFVDIGNAFFLPERQIDASRWDVYKIVHENPHMPGIKTPIYKFIPSNIPTLTVQEPKVEGSKVILQWKGEDKTEYAQPFGLSSRKDPTILLGETKGSDLKYFYTIKKPEGVVLQDSTINTFLELKGLGDGDYNLEALVRDEVGNKSDMKKSSFSVFAGENRPPSAPILFLPPLGTSDAPISLNPNSRHHLSFSWKHSEDPDKDDVLYDLYVNDAPYPNILVASNLNHNYVSIDKTSIKSLKESTTYYWKVVAKDKYGASSSSDIWNFKTINNEKIDFLGKIFFVTWYDTNNIYYMDGSNDKVKGVVGYKNIIPSIDVTSTGDKVAFSLIQSDARYDDAIYTVKPDGTNIKRIVNGTTFAWSPSGSRIVYESAYSLGILDQDGKIEALDLLGEEPSWSPNEKRILYSYPQIDENYLSTMQIHLLSLDKKDKEGKYETRKLTTQGSNISAKFSPDGTNIVFLSNKYLYDAGYRIGGYCYELYTMNPDGTDQKRLSYFLMPMIDEIKDLIEKKSWDNLSNYSTYDPYWSPDGKNIVFSSTVALGKDVNYKGLIGRDNYTDQDIYIMNSDGTDVKKLTPFSYQDDHHPVWSK